jgi:DNA-binding NarL/FixJ family response regulator
MERIRVLVANRPRLMRELVLATVSDQPDIDVIGELVDDAQIMSAVEDSEPDFLIMALDKPDVQPTLCTELLTRHPRMRIVALAPERNSSMFLWAVVSVQSARIESSEDGILNALRSSSHMVGS